MTLGSLFDGIGGFPLAGAMCGITPVWSSEIEPFPLKVTAARFPEMKQLGSVTEINGAEIEPVDIITFGSPCQDLSVAGKQLGIHDGQRSNLFFEAIRIIKEMRDATRASDHIRPRFAVWENVPGAFSSNKGADFKAVLEAFAGVCEDGVDVPQPKKWNTGGGILGSGWSLAWRVYDAQYWGVPQRRKRIYLVADFASERAPEILFERESVCGDSEKSGAAGKGTAADAEGGAGGGCIFEPRSLMEENWAKSTVKNALRANASKSGHCVVQAGVCYPINTMVATRGGKDDMRTCFGIGEPGDPQFTISAAHEHGVCYALQGNGIDRRSTQNGCGYANGYAYTLNATDRHAVAFDCRNMVVNEEISTTIQAKSNGGQSLNYVNPVVYPSTARTLTARHDSSPCVDRGQNVVAYVYDARGNGNVAIVPTMTGSHNANISDYTAVLVERREMNQMDDAICIGNGQVNQTDMGDRTGALNCMNDQQAVVTSGNPPRKYILRRLTPTECARLQGFPDDWCAGLGGSDSAIYKAYGNGLALPCAYDVLSRIAKEANTR